MSHLGFPDVWEYSVGLYQFSDGTRRNFSGTFLLGENGKRISCHQLVLEPIPATTVGVPASQSPTTD